MSRLLKKILSVIICGVLFYFFFIVIWALFTYKAFPCDRQKVPERHFLFEKEGVSFYSSFADVVWPSYSSEESLIESDYLWRSYVMIGVTLKDQVLYWNDFSNYVIGQIAHVDREAGLKLHDNLNFKNYFYENTFTITNISQDTFYYRQTGVRSVYGINLLRYHEKQSDFRRHLSSSLGKALQECLSFAVSHAETSIALSPFIADISPQKKWRQLSYAISWNQVVKSTCQFLDSSQGSLKEVYFVMSSRVFSQKEYELSWKTLCSALCRYSSSYFNWFLMCFLCMNFLIILVLLLCYRWIKKLSFKGSLKIILGGVGGAIFEWGLFFICPFMTVYHLFFLRLCNSLVFFIFSLGYNGFRSK